ncbi:hypothetical protein ACI68E_002309 [Malassezia pachydermatis]|uniref:Uncharacterized protein n=1 Tax=Malassezia pachydermatis TaxID=77020 RepID=A0A0M8MWD3_9BASI|nr:hypothetical protein Malapachy_0904 [Malassezia pachydermatis]KOS15110.1 hypothetical protein Malapachy_0904 [Malassezia pachydermatis]
MPSVFEGLLYVLALYWAYIFYQRWSIHRRTKQFVLEQRRKAGIPDTDHRPMAIAAADAAARRKKDFEKQLQETDDVFGTAQVKTRKSAQAPKAAQSVFRPRPVPMVAQPVRREPVKELETFYGPASSKRMVPPRSAAPTRKREADEISEADTHAGTASSRARRVRRKVSVEDVSRTQQEDDVSMDEDELSTDDAESMEEDDVSVDEPASAAKKRPADTSEDHVPGDEWQDANGLRWRIGEDGVPRRAVMVVEMKPKYHMPRDTQHPDARVRVPTYVEKFLSHDEYEDAKRKNQLRWQHESKQVPGSPVSFQSDDTIEDSLASLRARRHRGDHHSRHSRDLLFSDVAHSGVLSRSRASSVIGDDSVSNMSMSEWSADDSASSLTSLQGDGKSASGRLRLARSTASPHMRSASPARSGPLLSARYARLQAASPSASSLSPARVALDQATKRKREERLMAKIRSQRMASTTSPSQTKKEGP